jgi:phage terminase small subunit
MGNIPSPPKDLSAEARKLWTTYVAGWSLDEHSLVVLQLALECHDRMREAQKEIKRRGYGPSPKGAPNPFNVERDSRRDLAKLLRSLGLVLDPGKDSRP